MNKQNKAEQTQRHREQNWWLPEWSGVGGMGELGREN